MCRHLFIFLALIVCSSLVALPTFGLDEAETQPAAVASEAQDAPADLNEKTEPVAVCGVDVEVKNEAVASNTSWMNVDLALLPAPAWNCNGCIEPSPCQTHAQCGFPQGRCIQNICRCICDPDV